MIYKTHGSWEKAVLMCNFKDGFKDKEKADHTVRYERQDLLEYLKIYTEENRQIPTATDFSRGLLPSYKTYIRHFGNIENARQEAGVYQIVSAM